MRTRYLMNRRDLMHGLTIAGGAGLLGLDPSTALAEPPPETNTIRLIRDPKFSVLCYAPQYIAEEFLEIEGFTDVRYVPKGVEGSEAQELLHDQADISAALAVDWVIPIAKGLPVVVLSGMHSGCVEIFANETVPTVADLKGKRIAVFGLESPERFLLASILAYIGLDPSRDVEWVFGHPLDWGEMLVDGKVDALAAFPPMNYALHDAKIGTVILNTTTDDPWRHYFCCMLAARREYADRYPIATKRAIRAILKATMLCVSDPEVAARQLVANQVSDNYDYTLQTLLDTPYDAWRTFDPEAAIRFYSLRLREAGLIEQTPEEIIAKGTDWRIIDQLRKELKA